MNFYISLLSATPLRHEDLTARSQLLRERGVMYTSKQTWVTGSGWLFECRTYYKRIK